MFAGQEIGRLKNALKKFRKLSFMTDMSYLQEKSDTVPFLYYSTAPVLPWPGPFADLSLLALRASKALA